MISLILVILAGILNAGMDTMSMKYDISVFRFLPKKFFNTSFSYKNKWKNGDRSQGERFIGSSTFLVWTTDAWHLFKTLMLLCFSISIVSYVPITNPLIDCIGYFLIFGATFELFWSKIFIKK
jgi:hypothetical protein